MKNNEEQNLRALHSEINVLSRTDGSALFTQGDTAIMVGVYGPVEVKPQKLQIDRASIEVVYRPQSGLTSVADRMKESLIRETCNAAVLVHSYPRTSVSITVQEMQDSGGLLACALNAACMALIDSGVALKFMFAAVNCMVDQQDRVIIDPSNSQQKNSKASATLVFDSMENNVVASHTVGSFSPLKFNECLIQCQLASEKIITFYRTIVTKYANKIV